MNTLKKIFIVLFVVFLFSPLITKAQESMWEIEHYNDSLSYGYSDVLFINDSTGWILTSNTILSTTDGGENWKDHYITDASLNDFTFVNNATGWVVGNNGHISHTVDGGETWDEQATGTDKDLNSVFFLNEDTGWCAGDDITILSTSDGGNTWEKRAEKVDTTDEIEPLYDLGDIHFVNETTGWATIRNKFIINTQDGGDKWEIQLGHRFGNDVIAIDFINDSTGWAVGDNGYKTTDGGETWAEQNITPRTCIDVNFLNENVGWVISHYRGVSIAHTVDGGKNWNAYDMSELGSAGGISFIDDSTGWAVGNTYSDGEALLSFSKATTTNLIEDVKEKDFSLHNYPNPFESYTTIEYELDKSGEVILDVFDAHGRKVSRLVEEELSKGSYTTRFEPLKKEAGIYYYRLTVNGHIQTQKMVYLK